MPNLFKLFKKTKTPLPPVPDFPRITLEDIPGASACIFYGGTKITELFGNKLYKFPYRPAPFHASLYLGDLGPLGKGMTLNVGKWKELMALDAETRSTRRVDIVVYDITDEQRKAIVEEGAKDTTKPKMGLRFTDYAFTDFLRFGLKFLRPSKNDFCSENVAENMAAGGVQVSDNKPVDTAPWDLVEYALANPSKCKIYTFHVGQDYQP